MPMIFFVWLYQSHLSLYLSCYGWIINYNFFPLFSILDFSITSIFKRKKKESYNTQYHSMHPPAEQWLQPKLQIAEFMVKLFQRWGEWCSPWVVGSIIRPMIHQGSNPLGDGRPRHQSRLGPLKQWIGASFKQASI